MTRCEPSSAITRPKGFAALEAWGRKQCPESALGRLEPVVERLSKGFTDARPEAFSAYLEEPDALLAYALFFAPQTYVRVAEALRGILSRLKGGQPSRPLRVLDLGCGVGSAALAAVDVLEKVSGLPPEVTLVDWAEAALRVARTLLPGARTVRANLREFVPEEGRYDVIVSSFAFNEAFPKLSEAVAVLRRWIGGLSEEADSAPFVLLLEPVSHETTPRFLSLRERLRELPLYAPCPHGAPCPMAATLEGVCHDVRRFRPTRAMTLLNRRLFRTISDVKYALLAFGRAGGPQAEGFGEAEFLRLVGPMEKSKGVLTCRACMGDGGLRRLELPAAALGAERRHALLERQRGDCAWLDGPLEVRRQLEGGRVQRAADLRFVDELPPELDAALDGFSFSV